MIILEKHLFVLATDNTVYLGKTINMNHLTEFIGIILGNGWNAGKVFLVFLLVVHAYDKIATCLFYRFSKSRLSSYN